MPFAFIPPPSLHLDVIFIAASLIVGLFVVIESSVMIKNDGKMPMLTAFAIIGIITSTWTFVACLAFYFLDFGLLGTAVAAVYPLYSILSLLYSTKLLRGTDLPDDPMDIALPLPYLQFCQAFGLVYAVLCVAALFEVYGVLKLPL